MPHRSTILPAVVFMLVAPEAAEAQRRPTGRTTPTVQERTYTARWDDVVKEAHTKGYCFSIEDYSYSMKTAAMATGPSPSVTLTHVYYDLGAPFTPITPEQAVGGSNGEIREGVQLMYSGDGPRTYRLLGAAVGCTSAWEFIAPDQVVCKGGDLVERPRLLRDAWSIESMQLRTPSAFILERIPRTGDRDPTVRLRRVVANNLNLPPVAGTITGTVEFRGPRGARWQDAFDDLGRCGF